MDNQIETVKSRIDIVDYIGSIVQLKKAGRNFKAICPFHQEKSPSFVVSPERQTWHCFGACHEGGDVLSFMMKWENITFYEALKELAERVGVTLQSVGFEDQEWNKKDRLLRINSLASKYFEYVLHSTSVGKTGLDYLIERKLPVPIIKKFQIGYAPRSWDSLLNFLTKKQFKKEEIHEAGLLVHNDSGRYYDRFRGRIMFPIHDMRGNIIGFSGRLIEHTENTMEGKYINTPESPIYHKRESLYGIHIAREVIRKQNNVILVEGEFDMISPYIHGVENIVAIKGSAVTKEQLTILKRLTKSITLALDADLAGEDAMRRGIEEAEKQEFEVSVITFDSGKDPDEAIRNDLVSFKKSLKSPVPIYDFIIHLAQKKYPENNAFSKKNIGDFALPFIARIQNPIVQSHYCKKLATLLDVSDESIVHMIKRLKFQRYERKSFLPKNTSVKQQDREELLQKQLLSIMLQHDNPYELFEKIFGIINIEDFTAPSHQKICNAISEYKTSHANNYSASDFVKTLTRELIPVYDELFMFSSNEIEFSSDNIIRLIYEVKRTALKHKIAIALEEEGNNQQNIIAELAKTLTEVENRIQTL